MPGLDKVGERMAAGEMFIPEVLLSAKVMQEGLDVFKPMLSEKEAAEAGAVVIGTEASL